MRPAREGREHSVTSRATMPATSASMRPAREGREHFGMEALGKLGGWMLQ